MTGQPEPVWAVVVALVGLSVGSFLNVVIYRLPRELSVVHPRSFCPSCRHGIAWYDNMPVVSYVILGGHCRHCRAPFSIRYALVELLTAGLFVGLWCGFGGGLRLGVYWALAAALVASTFIDFDFRIIPDEITLTGIVVGLVISVAYPALHDVSSRF